MCEKNKTDVPVKNHIEDRIIRGAETNFTVPTDQIIRDGTIEALVLRTRIIQDNHIVTLVIMYSRDWDKIFNVAVFSGMNTDAVVRYCNEFIDNNLDCTVIDKYLSLAKCTHLLDAENEVLYSDDRTEHVSLAYADMDLVKGAYNKYKREWVRTVCSTGMELMT